MAAIPQHKKLAMGEKVGVNSRTPTQFARGGAVKKPFPPMKGHSEKGEKEPKGGDKDKDD